MRPSIILAGANSNGGRYRLSLFHATLRPKWPHLGSWHEWQTEVEDAGDRVRVLGTAVLPGSVHDRALEQLRTRWPAGSGGAPERLPSTFSPT
jgi:hypothetical protein